MTVPISLDVSAVPANPAGAGRYVVELVHQLANRGDVSLQMIARRDDSERWSAMSGSPTVHAVAPDTRPLRLLWEQLRLPTLVDGGGAALHHGPHYTLPERATLPLVATVHDMTFFDHPEWHERSKVILFKRAITKAVERASGLVAVSADTARRLVERFPAAQVTVIPHGVDHDRFNPRGVEAEDLELLARSGISGRYIAYVGTLEPRKNVPALLRAFDHLAHRDAELQLVLAGRPGWKLESFERSLSQMHYGSRVIRTGFLPDAAVPALLRRAQVVAYPSLTEGFGLPALEALACGAALVTTRGSAMEEVVDDAALLVAPDSDDDLSAALEQLTAGGAEVDRLRRRGPEVASAYTWAASAHAHVELYRSLI